jgi:hypothetical protein
MGSQGSAPVCVGTTWTPSDVAALEQALATGALRVKYRDHEVMYRSQNDMFILLRTMKAAVCGPAAATVAAGIRGGRGHSFARMGSSCCDRSGFRGMDY